MNIKNNLILALDVTDKDKAIEICKEVSPYINTIKIGYPLTLSEGLEIIKIIKDEFGANIICDYKVADIDATNSKICDLTFDAGADAIICHGFVGSDSVHACLDSANKHEKEIFLLTEMSHPGAKMFLQKDAEAIGVKDGDKVKVSSRRGKIETTAVVGTKVSPGETWMPFHFPDGNCNWLTNAALDKFAKAPEYKVCAIKITKA